MRAVFYSTIFLELDWLAIPALRGLSPSLIYSSETAYAQGASRGAHSCCAGEGAHVSLSAYLRCAGTELFDIDATIPHTGQGGPS